MRRLKKYQSREELMRCCTNTANPAIVVRGTLSVIDSLHFYGASRLFCLQPPWRSLTSGVSPLIS
jgi:hypothetical protein